MGQYIDAQVIRFSGYTKIGDVPFFLVLNIT